MQAISYIQTQSYAAAKSSLTDCIETDKDFAWLYLLRGFASGQLAERDLKLVATNPGREKPLKDAAEFEFGAAEDDFKRALEKLTIAPDRELTYILLVNRGLVRFQRDQLKQAAADYQEAIQLDKNRFEAYAELAHVYEKEHKIEQAVEQFTRAIALKPEWSPLYRGRAKVLAAGADKDPARRAAALADLDRSIMYQQKTSDPVLALDHTNRGLLLLAGEKVEDALAESRLALAVEPTVVDANALQVIVDAHVLQIRCLNKLRRFDEAIRSCDAAIALGKKSAVLYELRGLANGKRNAYADAIHDFGESLELRPNNAQVLAYRGWQFLFADSPTLALKDFEAAIKLAPADGDAYNGRGTARVLRGDHAGAVADANEAVRRGGTGSRVVYNAARIYALASVAVAKELGEKGRQARQLSIKYEDTALRLIRQAFEREAPEKRAAFWRETVQPDPALKSIRRRIKFEDLIVTNK